MAADLARLASSGGAGTARSGGSSAGAGGGAGTWEADRQLTPLKTGSEAENVQPSDTLSTSAVADGNDGARYIRFDGLQRANMLLLLGLLSVGFGAASEGTIEASTISTRSWLGPSWWWRTLRLQALPPSRRRRPRRATRIRCCGSSSACSPARRTVGAQAEIAGMSPTGEDCRYERCVGWRKLRWSCTWISWSICTLPPVWPPCLRSWGDRTGAACSGGLGRRAVGLSLDSDCASVVMAWDYTVVA